MRKQVTLVHRISKAALSMGLALSLLTPTAVFAQESVTPSNGTSDENISLTSGDVTKPVIEEIIFPDNGATKKVGEEAPIYVKAYDTGDGIQYVQLSYSLRKDNGDSSFKDIRLTYNETEKRYEGKITAVDGGYTKVEIESIRAVDRMGNIGEGKVKNDENYAYLYTFQIEGGTDSNLSYNIETFDFKENGATVDRGDELHISLTLPQETSEVYDEISIAFLNEKSGDRDSYILQKKEGTNQYIGTLSVHSRLASGKWILDQISVTGHSFVLSDIESYTFTINGETERPVITSIMQDHHGDTVKVGDKVTLKVKASDNVGLDTENGGTAYYRSSAQISNSYRYVHLDYDETSDSFIGVFEVDDSTYPCEWYLESISIYDTSGNSTNLNDNEGNKQYPYYFYVSNGETIVNPTYSVNINFRVLDEHGDYIEIGSVKKEDVERRTTLKDAGIKFPDGSTTYKGLKFIGWIDSDGNPVDEQTPILNEMLYTSYYAVYDKTVIDAGKQYVGENQTFLSTSEKLLMPKGTTYRDVLAIIESSVPSDLYAKDLLIGWECELYNNKTLDDVINQTQNSHVSFQAIYKDKKAVIAGQNYYGVDGRVRAEMKAMLVDAGTTYEEVIDRLKKQETPEFFEGLRFKEWKFHNQKTGVIQDNYDFIMRSATYENCMIRVVLDDMFKGDFGWAGYGEPYWEYVQATTAEVGETITIPEVSAYTNIKWRSFGNEVSSDKTTFIVKGDMDFVGYGDKVEEENPVDPVDPEKPLEPEEPNEPDKPIIDSSTKDEIYLSQDTVQSLIQDIQSATSKEVVQVVMGNALVLPKDILQAAKGKDIDVKVVMNGYTWTINGKNIIADNLKDINLEVTLNADAVPSSVVKKLAGDLPTKQLSLTHNGDFGFTADLSFNLGDTYAGKYGNLYYYDSDGKMVFMNAGKINEQGDVTVSFSHASDYVIVINDVVMSNEDAIKETAQDTASTSGSMVLIGICVLFAYGYFTSKKQGKA